MTLATGDWIGWFEIAGSLGAGGMGVVFRARDSRLNRDVALKVLREAFTRDSDRLARFRREAQVLASLNHPSIAAIYGFEESNGTSCSRMVLIVSLDVRRLTVGSGGCYARRIRMAIAKRRLGK